LFFGQYLKITKEDKIFGLLISTEQATYVSSLTKNGLGYILGNIFKNSSGHPAQVRVM
jgi:hypothetical protein